MKHTNQKFRVANYNLKQNNSLKKFELWRERPTKNKTHFSVGFLFLSRGSKIRTCDLLLPKQARYRATLYPEKRFANLKKFYISKPKNFFILRRDGDSNPGYPVRGTLV